MYKLYEEYILSLHNAGKYRRLGAISQEKNLEILDFSTNDYLNLSANSNLLNAAQLAGKLHGVGATGSRLLSGNSELYEAFEQRIAQDKGTEASLIFNSGFQANLSVLSSLLDQKVLGCKPLVFFDKLNHSSLYQAVFLSQAELIRYHHNNIAHLEGLLMLYQYDNRPKYIVTETVFGMDGDIVHLAEIVALCRKYGALLYLDEAHATGLFGANGYGLSTNINLQDIQHIVMGTFSKALGCSGGYVACSHVVREFLINKATGFIYSTALSPMVIGAAFCAWQLIPSFEQERGNLQKLGHILRNMLMDAGMNIGKSQTHIVPVIIGEEARAMQVKQALLDRGIVVSCIRPPTVPPGSARIRIALARNHTLDDLYRLCEALPIEK